MGSDRGVATRFKRVREIIREAAGENNDAFGGLPLWEFTREKLLAAKLHNILLIAPEKEAGGSCCHGKAGPETDAGRGARSGLVRGLRGEPPFDGSQLPRLPWGRDAISEARIQ